MSSNTDVTKGLKRTGFLGTLRYDATTTTAVLSSVAHTFNHCFTMSDLKSNLQSDHAVKINRSQILSSCDFDENLFFKPLYRFNYYSEASWVMQSVISSYKLVCVSIRANTKPKARRYARPKGGHYEGRGLCIRMYRYANQLVRSLLPD